MKLKTRLIIFFTLLSIIPIGVVGYLGYLNQSEALLKKTLEQVVSVVEIQEQRVNEKLDRYIEQAKLITSRTQLRASIANYNQSQSTADAEQITKIINDAKESISTVSDVSVLDLSGLVIASTNPDEVGKNKSEKNHFINGQKTHLLDDLVVDKNNLIKVVLAGPFIFENELVGVVEVIAKADSILAITADYSGLGRTGEALLGKRNSAGDAVFLTPLRFDSSAALRRAIPKQRDNIPIVGAVNGVEKIYLEKGIVDYRGEQILAVTRFIDSLDWGLVVKIDRAEAFGPINAQAFSYFSITLLSAFLVMVMSYIITHSITEPLRFLTLFAQNLQTGNYSLRTQLSSSDELGFLANTMNQMAERVEESHKNLEERVRSRTQDLEKSKAKDDAILASIGDGLVFTDVKQNVVLANRAAVNILGFTEAEMIGKNWPSLVKVKDEKNKSVSIDKLPISKVLKNKSTFGTSVLNPFFYTRKDGSIFPVSISASAVVVSGELIGAIVVFRDITTETEIDRAKSEFVSLASHQLRTPLSTINWYSEMLLAGDAGKVTPEQKKYLEEIYTGNQRMVALVNALLNVSRIELGTFSVEPEELNIIDIAKEVVKGIEPNLFKRKIGLTEKYEKEKIVMFADPKLMTIVIENLLTNAIKYSPEKTEIIFGINEVKGELILYVKDQGFGIPMDQQSKIFSKLFRADNVRAKETDGTGLGLYITKSIVEHSGGKIGFVSEENKGTIFTATLPLKGMKKKTGSKRIE